MSAHECITCEGGLYNTAGDSAWEPILLAMQRVLKDYHCDSDEECNKTMNACKRLVHRINSVSDMRFAEGPAASPDYACSDDMPLLRSRIDTHCSNDLMTPYCDGNETTEDL